MENENKVMVDFDALQMLAQFVNKVSSGMNQSTVDLSKSDDYVSPFAAYLLAKAEQPIVTRNGTILSKSAVDETTLDFTMGRTLSEEQEVATIRYIYDQSPFLSVFNSRIVNKIVVPIEGRVITSKNLISNEKKGGAVSNVNRRIVHTFGVKLLLENFNCQKNIPLQTVVDNMYNPNFESDTMRDVAIAIANDILLLAVNGIGGNYASTENFYDLNKGFVKILQEADGQHTNSYDNIMVTGWAGKHLTPQKIDATGATGANYNATNLLALMRNMYKAMLSQYRDNPNNVWMMSQTDADLYMDSRSDMTNPSNPYRENVLTSGMIPNFMGRRVLVVPNMVSINEVHEYDTSLNGVIIYGDPKNLEIATSSKDILRTMKFDARGSEGAVFEYDFHGYSDFQAVRPESFVIAYKGAKLSTPYLVSESGNKTGTAGKLPDTSGTYAYTGASLKFAVYCDNVGATVVKKTSTMAGYATLADAIAGGCTIVEQGKVETYSADTYFVAYHPHLGKSAQIFFDITT